MLFNPGFESCCFWLTGHIWKLLSVEMTLFIAPNVFRIRILEYAAIAYVGCRDETRNHDPVGHSEHLTYHLICKQEWNIPHRTFMNWTLFWTRTSPNAACRESTLFCVSSEQRQCWTEQDTIVISSSSTHFYHWASHCAADVHICVYPSWCWRKRWPESWSYAGSAAERRRSCRTPFPHRNAAQGAGNSMSDHPERERERG